MVGQLGKHRMLPFRLATLQDIPVLVKLCEEAHKESPHRLRFDKEQVEASIFQVIQTGVIICYIVNGQVVGMIGGITTLTTMSLEKIGAELLWFIHPDYRKSREPLKLITAFEYWCWSKGCAAVTLSNMVNDSYERVGKVYERKGYRLVEQSYMKSLKGN